MAKYDVTITETLQTTVEIEARDRFHAEQLASDNWRNSEYILDADHFQGVRKVCKKRWKRLPPTASG